MLVYVDDILITGEDSKIGASLITYLNKKFALKMLGPVHYFLEFEAIRNESSLTLTQTKYILDLLKKTNMINAKESHNLTCTGGRLSLANSK